MINVRNGMKDYTWKDPKTEVLYRVRQLPSPKGTKFKVYAVDIIDEDGAIVRKHLVRGWKLHTLMCDPRYCKAAEFNYKDCRHVKLVRQASEEFLE